MEVKQQQQQQQQQQQHQLRVTLFLLIKFGHTAGRQVTSTLYFTS